jgi:conjugative relaxase-like TrwC/TraI family protein
MITITPLLEKDVERASKELFEEEFRTRRLGTFGYWLGQGAKFLELKNPASQESFQNLVHGLTPDGSQKMISEGGEPNRLASWRITLDGSKSLSVLWALAPEHDRDKIESAFLMTVRASLQQFERLLTERQTILCGKRAAAPIFAFFSCGTSWDQCPHLNATVFLLNHGVSQDGSVHAYSPLEILSEQPKLKWFYEGGLDYFVWKAIGPFKRVKGVDELRITGVPQELVTKFFFDPTIGAKQVEGERPEALLPYDALFAKWQKQADRCGWGPRDAAALLGQLRRERIAENITGECLAFVSKGQALLEKAWESMTRDLNGEGVSKNQSPPDRSKDHEHTRGR